MTFDAARNRVVLLATDEAGVRRIWELDEAGWTRGSVTFGVGHFTEWTALAYDERRAQVLVVVSGTRCQTSTSTGSCWREEYLYAWDGVSAQRLDEAPNRGWKSELTYFPKLGGVVYSSSSNLLRPDLWRWNGTEWIRVEEYEAPAPNRGPIVFDRPRGRVVLFDDDRETWEWDGSTWTLAAQQSGPQANGVQLVYDGVRERVVAVQSNETWTYDGTVWRDVTSSAPPPWDDSDAALVFDAARGRLVRHALGRTWEWDGARWNDLTPSSSAVPAVDGTLVAFDRRRERTVLVEPPNVWTWDGQIWTEFEPREGPPERFDARVLLYHEERGTTVYISRWTECSGGFFGGSPTCESHDDAWEWDGASWRTWPELLNELPSLGPSTYDPLRGQIVRWSGFSLRAFGPSETALIQLSIGHPEIEASDVVSGLMVRSHCGASTGRRAPERVGARLEVWSGLEDTGAWRVIDRNSASETARAEEVTRLDHQLVDDVAGVFEELVRSDGRIHVRCRPDATQTPGVPHVALDHAEVRIRTSAPPNL
jgi:hypothetical protein